jgi:hypothetical protein
MDMNNVQGFATPSDQAVTTSDEGIPRIAIDPVSAPDLEASPPPNKLQDSFLPRSDLDFDGDEEFERYELADEMRSIGLEPFPKLGADDRGVTLGNMSAGASDGSVGKDMLKAGYKGLEQGGAEMFDSAAFIAGAPVELAKNVMNVGLEAVGMEPVKNAFGDIESMKRMVRGYQSFVNDLIPTPDAVVEWSNQPYNNEMLGELIEGVTQFSVAAFPAAKMVKAMTTYNPVARGMIWGAIADFTAFNPDDPTLTNAITEHLEMAPPEERDAVLQAFMSQIEKYDTDGELTKRAKTALEGGIIGGVVEGAIKTARLIPFGQIIDGTKRAIGRAGDAADARIAERAADNSVTLTAGADPMQMIDAAISYAGKLVDGEKPIISEGGLPINADKAANELRLHQGRIDAVKEKGKPYPGEPKNQRTVIKAPAGSGLPDITVGDIKPEDWQSRIEATMSPDEIIETSQWYKKVFGEFQKQANGDPKEIARLTDAWFAGQQNSSPSQTLNDVLFVYEQVKAGVPKDQLKGKGLPSANKIVIDILTQSEITGGAGQKISDFLDSGYGKNVRSFMNNDPAGGAPFVVDVHTARDMGLVDETYVNHMKRLGYDVPDDIVIDFGGGGIKGAMYENRALFGAQLTDHLNSINWMGKSDWEAAEVQAIGWMQLSGMYGTPNVGGDVVDAFAKNTRRISMEVDPGEGSPWATKFGDDYANLDDAAKISINDQVTAKAIEVVNKREGVNLGGVVHGTGGWELFQNPSTVQQAIASKDTAVRAAARLGLLLNQTEVWVNAPKSITKNPKHFAVDIIEDGSELLRDSDKLKSLFEALVEAEPNGLFRGYQPIIVDGKPGIKIIIDDAAIKQSPLSKAQAQDYILDFANKRLSEITDKLEINAEVDIMETELTKLRNDWTKDKDGGGYKSYLGGQPGKDAISGQSDIDIDRGELENLFGELISNAKSGSAETN